MVNGTGWTLAIIREMDWPDAINLVGHWHDNPPICEMLQSIGKSLGIKRQSDINEKPLWAIGRDDRGAPIKGITVTSGKENLKNFPHLAAIKKIMAEGKKRAG